MLFPNDRRGLAGFWLYLAVYSLAFSGMLAILVGGARMPFIASLIHDTSFTKRVLIVHVDLGVLTWFAAIPATLFHFWISLHEQSISYFQRFMPILAVVGSLLVSAGLFMTGHEPLLVNYIPLIDHPVYHVGLLLIFVSVGLSFSDPPAVPEFALRALQSARLGIGVGALYYLLALISFVFAFNLLDRASFGGDSSHYFETLMWGPGHVLQLVNGVFAIVAWGLLSSYLFKDDVFSPRLYKLVFLWLLVPGAAIIFLNFFDPAQPFYRANYTRIMQWGIFPPSLVFLLALIRQCVRHKVTHIWRNAVFVNLFFSVLLILIGYVMGAFISGPDLRVPGHYHASIGAVTLAYMGLALLFIGKRINVNGFQPPERRRALYMTSLVYGMGQIIFSSGLFVAGAFGMARKIYGVEQSVSHPGQSIGFAIMAVGGLFAFIGGGIFAVSAIFGKHQGARSEAARLRATPIKS